MALVPCLVYRNITVTVAGKELLAVIGREVELPTYAFADVGPSFYAHRRPASRYPADLLRFTRFYRITPFCASNARAMKKFERIKRLPPYVFNVTGELKL